MVVAGAIDGMCFAKAFENKIMDKADKNGIQDFFGTFTATLKHLLGLEGPDLQELFFSELKDIYWAEKELLNTLPRIAEKATTNQLKQAIHKHVNETKGHVQRLEEVFALIGEKPQSKTCEAMQGLLDEAGEIIGETKDGTVLRDVGIILAAQKVEHYEIATYGTLKALAQVLGHEDAAEFLNLTLMEEKNADDSLTKIAEGFVNLKAQEESLKK
jgi:ferritin-like metal-binding protein YciE